MNYVHCHITTSELPPTEFDPAPQLTIGSSRKRTHTIRQKGEKELDELLSKIVVYEPHDIAGFIVQVQERENIQLHERPTTPLIPDKVNPTLKLSPGTH